MRFGDNLLIYEIDQQEAWHLRIDMNELVLRGNITDHCREVFEQWRIRAAPETLAY